MISPFLKKLLFARQFSMIDGKIEILGKKQILLPKDVFSELEKCNSKGVYSSVKNVMKKNIDDYAKKLGSSGEGMLNILGDIFDTFGLGDMQIVDIDYKKKNCVVRIHNIVLMEKNSKDGLMVTPAILSGMFSFLFRKDVDAKKIKPRMGVNYYEYVVR